VIEYRVFIAADVVEYLRTCRKPEQKLITRSLSDLGGNPYRKGDYVEQDDIGRPIQVIIIGRHALYFWADHAVKELKILDLKLAGS
jgi:hypothetical protein